jgi:hypothetical protein
MESDSLNLGWNKHMDTRLDLLKYGGYDFHRAYRNMEQIRTMSPSEIKTMISNIPYVKEDTLLTVINDEIRLEKLFRDQLISNFGEAFSRKCFTSTYPRYCAELNVRLIRENISNILSHSYAQVLIEYNQATASWNTRWLRSYVPGVRLFVISLRDSTKVTGHAICAVINKDNIIDIFDSNGRVLLWPMPPSEAEEHIGKVISRHIMDVSGEVYRYNTIPETRPNINFMVQGLGTCATWAIFMLDFYVTQGSNSINDAIDKLRRTVPLHVLRSMLINYAAWIFKALKL